MSPETVFSLANGLALISWIYLAIFPFRPATPKIILGTSITLLCAAYAFLVLSSLKPGDFESFSTLAGVTSMMSIPGAALVGWLHYLAFDLMTGLFIAGNGAKHGIKHVTLLPCFFLTFMLGPVGLLLYLIIRWAITRNYWADIF
jgi:hypothetical protein